MKIYSVPLSASDHHIMWSRKKKECDKERDNIKQNNYDNTNTSIKRNLDARASFKGGVPAIHKAATFTYNNSLLSEAIFALLITCGLRPASIMATANSKSDKDKCTYQAAKSISSGIMGLVMTVLVATPILAATKLAKKNKVFKMPKEMRAKSMDVVKKGIEELENLQGKVSNTQLSEHISKIVEHKHIEKKSIKDGKVIKETENLDLINLNKIKELYNNTSSFKKVIKENTDETSLKHIEAAIKEQNILNRYESTSRDVAERLFQPISMPVRAAFTIEIIPPILNYFGIKKSDNTKKDCNTKSLNTTLYQSTNAQELFKPFSGIVNNEKHSDKKQTPSFKGAAAAPNKLVSGIAYIFKKVYSNETYQKGVKAFSNLEESFHHLLAIESTILSSFYILCTLQNEKIDKEQKPQMVINDALTLGFSTAGAYLTDGKINKWVGNKAENYLKEHKDFYLDLGKKNQEKEKNNPLNDLIEKIEQVSKKKGDALDVGMVETENLIDNHLNNADNSIVGKKAFQISEAEFKNFKNDILDTITNPETMDVKKSVKQIAEKYYDLSLARSEANKFMSGIGKLKVLIIFGFIYRFIGPVFFTPVANKLSSWFFPSKADIAEMKAAA